MWAGRSSRKMPVEGGTEQTGLGVDQHSIAAGCVSPALMHKQVLAWAPCSLSEEGSSSLKEDPKLDLGTVSLSHSFCKARGKVKQNQRRRAGELKDHCRKTGVALGT